MAGKPGMKGGGGARPGAGRKPKEPSHVGYMEPMAFLEGVQAGTIEASPSQLRAATALLAYKHHKLGEGGKKDAQGEAAKKAGAGKFAAAQPPLKLVGKR